MMQKIIHPAVWFNEVRSNVGVFAYKRTKLRRNLFEHGHNACNSIKVGVRTSF